MKKAKECSLLARVSERRANKSEGKRDHSPWPRSPSHVSRRRRLSSAKSTFAFVRRGDSHSISLSIKISSGKRLKTRELREISPPLPLAGELSTFSTPSCMRLTRAQPVVDMVPSVCVSPPFACLALKIFRASSVSLLSDSFYSSDSLIPSVTFLIFHSKESSIVRF